MTVEVAASPRNWKSAMRRSAHLLVADKEAPPREDERRSLLGFVKRCSVVVGCGVQKARPARGSTVSIELNLNPAATLTLSYHNEKVYRIHYFIFIFLQSIWEDFMEIE